MSADLVKVSDGGRVVIPSAFRKEMGIEIGDELVLHMEKGRLMLLTRQQAIAYVQEQAASYRTDENLLSEQLMQERREDAKSE